VGRLNGRVAIVTGAARGMGASHARALVQEGARVVLTDVLEDEGSRMAKQLGESALFVAHDVSSLADWERVVATAEREFGDVGILVNNAGIGFAGPIEDTTEADYRRVIDVNQVGVFLGMKSVLASMTRAGGGSIINISSVAGLTGQPNNLSYTASKWAITGMTRATAKEFAPRGIRVNSIHPGLVDTPILNSPNADEIIKAAAAFAALGRIGRPEEVSAVVLFLASDDSSFVTGSAYVVDGGMMQ
jgi:3alpha(or 20beta)-hydroxysteroid dehydrogenase